ncbi:MAG: RNA polymerase sigma factor [Firmicutes bacterium]|nr:RNA polymerase sigma factor [Bacillota bacterium]
MDIETIYNKYFRIIYRYLLSLCGDPHLAEELAQETFLKALSQKEPESVDDNVNAWLYTIARNLYFQQYNKSRRRQKILKQNTSEQFADSPETVMMQKQGKFRIHQLLHELAEPYREVFMLRNYGELSFREIAEIFGRNETWARTIYYRARKKLMEDLRDEDHM